MSGLSDKFYERMIERAESMTLDETRVALKKAGVLNDEGKLAKRYRAPEPQVAAQPQSE